MDTAADPLQLILEERKRQDDKWGEQNHNDLYWLGILMEEVGELSKAIIESKPEDAHKELVQVAAVAVAWLECIKRNLEYEQRQYKASDDKPKKSIHPFIDKLFFKQKNDEGDSFLTWGWWN